MLNAAPPRAGIHIPKAKDLRKPETTNLSLSLGGVRGIFSHVREYPPYTAPLRGAGTQPRRGFAKNFKNHLQTAFSVL